MDPNPDAAEVDAAFARLPYAPCLMTAAHDGRREGVLVHWVMRCATEPPLVGVAVRIGQPIEPIIQGSRSFGLSIVGERHEALCRRCAPDQPRDADPLAALPLTAAHTGSPLLAGASMALDCRVVRHIDLEADHALYVGRVVAVL